MKKQQCNFLVEPENKKRLEMATANGLNMSEVINDLIRDYFKPYIENKAKRISQLATASN
jgi:hypothetical protein